MSTRSKQNKPKNQQYQTSSGEITRLTPLPKALSYAAVVDVNNKEIEITDLMVQKACRDMAKFEQFPFAPKKPSRSIK